MTNSNDRLDRIEALVESNSRAIQALADRLAELALVQQEAADVAARTTRSRVATR